MSPTQLLRSETNIQQANNVVKSLTGSLGLTMVRRILIPLRSGNQIRESGFYSISYSSTGGAETVKRFSALVSLVLGKLLLHLLPSNAYGQLNMIENLALLFSTVTTKGRMNRQRMLYLRYSSGSSPSTIRQSQTRSNSSTLAARQRRHDRVFARYMILSVIFLEATAGCFSLSML